MRIKITEIKEEPHKQDLVIGIVVDKCSPELGKLYDLKEFDIHTDPQRKLFEPLTTLYYNSGCYPYEASSADMLRDKIKIYLGAGYELFKYSDKNHKIKTVDNKDKIPDYVVMDYVGGNKERINGYPKSTTKYGKKDFLKMTDNLIRQMIQNGVLLTKQSTKFNKILDKIGFTE